MATESLTHEGMPSREGDLSVESHGMEPIPGNARYGSVGRIFTVWFTPNLVPAAFFIGTLVTLDFLKLGFVTSILAVVVGNVVGAFFVALLSTMGPKLGLAQMPAARLPFGKMIAVPGLLNWFSTIVWDGINSVFGAVALTLLIPGLPFIVGLIVIVLCQAALGILGYEAIHTFEKWGAIVLGAMFVVLTVVILGKADTSFTDGFSGANQIGAFIGMVAIVASFVLAWSLYASDYSRYLPENTSTSKVFWYTLAGMALASGWLEVLGVLVATNPAAAGGESSDTIFALLGGKGEIVAILAMIAIFIGTIAVNAMNDYTGSLSLQAAGFRVKRIYSAAIVAVLGFGFTLVLQYNGEFSANFFNFLLFISYWISPFVGVVLADWLLRGRRADATSVVDYARLPTGTLALAALITGFAVGIPFENSSLGYSWGGPFNYVTANYLHGADLAYYVGGAVAFLIYWFGARSSLRRA
ncbi:MAG: purine-cytosine permease family protein [Candidatus Limnocylindria bacterium]